LCSRRRRRRRHHNGCEHSVSTHALIGSWHVLYVSADQTVSNKSFVIKNETSLQGLNWLVGFHFVIRVVLIAKRWIDYYGSLGLVVRNVGYHRPENSADSFYIA